MGSNQTPALAEVKRIISDIDPQIRGTQAELTDSVRTRLGELREEITAEYERIIGEPFAPPADGAQEVVPDSARADYHWAAQKIAKALAASDPNAVSSPAVAAPAQVAPAPSQG